MSEPKLISPLLDGFLMGDPISDHHGVRCCPAMQMDSDSKYIVKVISVPSSQVKLDALLLAGAFSDAQSANAYFKDLAQGVVEEAVLLQRLSRLEGFIPYENWQVVPMEDGETGYDIYLTGAYRPTLERHFRRNTMTHLAAVNLGLDMCAALAVCRRSGYLYVDLKPGNVFVCDDREYRIGDLGFIPLSSLAYASLPEKYLSAYTAPEITDAYSALNTTMDVYAAGLILYQAYNNGVLPFEGRPTVEELPPPAYADYEMAQIILKACAPKPEDRWQDPLQMGQALVSYLQRNSVNDTPIVPPVSEEPTEEVPEESPAEAVPEEPSTEDILAEVDQALDAVGGVTEEAPAEEPEATEAPAPEEEIPAGEEAPADEEVSAETEEAPAEAEPVTEEAEIPAEEAVQLEINFDEETVSAPEADTVSEEPEIEIPAEPENALSPEAAALKEELGVSDEVSQILAQADDLIAHETPEPVVAPEPIEVTIPVPAAEEPQEPEEAEEEDLIEEDLLSAEEEAETAEETEAKEPDGEYGDSEDAPKPVKKKKGRNWLIALIVLVLLADLCIAGYLFYDRYYVQTIADLSIISSEDVLTVSLKTDISDDLLTVYCTDTYGNTLKQSVQDGKAVFDDLKPATSYKISVQISGFHRLIGETTGTFTTSEQTTIAGFTAATGSEDGSVILSFTVQGPDAGEWKITYQADGEEAKTVTFSGHMVTISGLTLGSHYTFHLEPASELYVVGTDTVEHTASGIIYAEDLTVSAIQGGSLTATWKAPEGTTVDSWTVRCYNDAGYDKTITVDTAEATFDDIDTATGYTVEVNAAGMTLGIRAYVSANSVTVGSIDLDSSDPNQLTVSWAYEGNAPQSGWLLLYSIDGSEDQNVVQCSDATGVISPIVPGSHYTISIQQADGSTVFGGETEYTAPDAVEFSGYLVTAANLDFQMCKTPAIAEWTQYNVPAADYKTTFSIGESASFAVFVNHEYNTSPDVIVTLFVIRDAQGNVVSTATQSRTWTSMWYRGFGRFNIPALPQTAGDYTIEVYFNGALANTQSFTMV